MIFKQKKVNIEINLFQTLSEILCVHGGEACILFVHLKPWYIAVPRLSVDGRLIINLVGQLTT